MASQKEGHRERPLRKVIMLKSLTKVHIKYDGTQFLCLLLSLNQSTVLLVIALSVIDYCIFLALKINKIFIIILLLLLLHLPMNSQFAPETPSGQEQV